MRPLWHDIDDDDAPRLGVAVSGGPDSLALLLLANTALPGRVVAATIDHGLRPEAADEAAMVGGLCERLGVLHHTVEVALEPGNTQDRARKARYEALCRCFGEQGADTFATAHHADDQAETLLMRFNRGSGLSGLAGIRARTVLLSPEPLGEYLVVRPLLEWRREELAGIVADAGLAPVQDPSNVDTRYDRVQVRRALADLPWLDPLAMARSARHLQEAEDAVRRSSADVYNRCTYREGETVWFHWGHARTVEIEAVRLILLEFGADVPRSSIARLIDQLMSEGAGSLGGVVARRAWHRDGPNSETDAWKFEKEPPRRTG
ncbi:tRNA lysidine(34) synthetase TilS [Erythrobacter litoralis]|uniref:tRNA(Ile)-lysidine synthase n=1 Tax=Erythrobacter litoralis (strain HTCC2594) TaxID=314225 RepID=Q2NDP6_ERYLH|nr:tRNA lysidine(34) synthetase TilS [Erythrobacter litoralis]ABC62195.1 ATPase [Erythrobacter litoralis HTCC2594]